MASGPLKAAEIIHKNFTFTNVPITQRSAQGAYYSTITTMDVTVAGYTPIGVSLVTWDGWVAVAEPYIRTDNKIAFVSDVSQTLNSVMLKVIYIKE